MSTSRRRVVSPIPDERSLSVWLHDQEIGSLHDLGGERTIFAWRDDYMDDPARFTLGLHFKDEQGGLMTEFRPYQTRLMPFFSNLLPEGPLRNYLASQAGVNPVREFQLLRALGPDLPGAVRVLPASERTDRAHIVRAAR